MPNESAHKEIGSIICKASDLVINGDLHAVEDFTPDSPMPNGDGDGDVIGHHYSPPIDYNLRRVAQFHATFGHPIKDAPDLSNEDLNRLRLRLLREEVDELEDSMWEKDPVKALDALTDIQYVLDGAFLALGLAAFKHAAAVEVHRSNMSKAGADGKPILDDGGKVLKGPNYSPPNLAAILETKNKEQ